MTPLVALAVAFTLAFITESFVEYIFGIPMKKVPKLEKYIWTLNYIALVVGVGLAFYYTVDLISLVAELAGGKVGITPVGIALTGMIIGRGSNFLNDFVTKFLKPNPPTNTNTTTITSTTTQAKQCPDELQQ